MIICPLDNHECLNDRCTEKHPCGNKEIYLKILTDIRTCLDSCRTGIIPTNIKEQTLTMENLITHIRETT